MGTQGIDFSSLGAVPANAPQPAPPPPPSGGGMDFSSLGAVPAQAQAAPSTPATPEAPASSWQRLKQLGAATWMKQNIASDEDEAQNATGVKGAIARTGMGAAKGLLQVAGYGAHLLASISDQASPKDVLAYQQEHPGASTDDAMSAVSGQDKDGNPTDAYRAPDNRQASQQLHESADWFKQASTTHGFWEGLGSTGEQLAELLATDGLSSLAGGLEGAQSAADVAKIPGLADKLKSAQGVAAFLEKNPKMARVLGVGVRAMHAAAKAGGQAAAQTYVHSQGDAGEAAAAGALGGVAGGTIDGGLQAAQALIEHLTPEIREIAGEATPFLRSQITRTGPDGLPVRPSLLQQIAANPADSQGVVDAQQAGAFGTVKDEAQQVLGRELGATNEARTVAPTETDPAPVSTSASNSNGRQVPVEEYVRPKPGPAVVDESDAGLTSGAPQLGTGTLELGSGDDAALAKTGMVGEPGAAPAAGAQGALPGDVAGGRYSVEDTSAPGLGGGQPIAGQLGAGKFELKPIDIKAAIAGTEDFGDAADHLHAAGKEVYDRLNEVTNGNWQAADARIRGLQSKVYKAIGPERDVLQQQLDHARGVMNQIYDRTDTGVPRAAMAAAKRNWNVGYTLRNLHNALEPAYQVDADFAKRTGEYRGFNGTAALSRFRQALRVNPELKNILGTQGSDNLQSIFKYNASMAGRQRFGTATSQIVRWLGERGKSVGVGGAGAALGYVFGGAHGAAELGVGAEAMYHGTKFVLHKIATDPAVGKQLLYALEYGARPENFAPTIGNMILRKAVPLTAGTVAQSIGGQ